MRAERNVRELDGDAAIEAAVASLGEPHRAHAALADGLEQPIGAGQFPGSRGLRRRLRRRQARPVLEEPLLANEIVRPQQRRELIREGGIL